MLAQAHIVRHQKCSTRKHIAYTCNLKYFSFYLARCILVYGTSSSNGSSSSIVLKFMVPFVLRRGTDDDDDVSACIDEIFINPFIYLYAYTFDQ